MGTHNSPARTRTPKRRNLIKDKRDKKSNKGKPKDKRDNNADKVKIEGPEGQKDQVE